MIVYYYFYYYYSLDVTLTYEIVGRPTAIRPIPGETVIFTCEVEGQVLTWRSPGIDAGQRDIVPSSFMVGERGNDTTSGKYINWW